MRDDFEGLTLREAARLLRDLPPGRAGVPEARARIAAWGAARPDLRPQLMVHREPGSARIEYDLMLDDPEGGTLGLCWRADDGVPWLVAQAQHWAANAVLTVDGESVTVQEALRQLRVSAQAHPDLVSDLIDQKILFAALRQDGPEVGAAELQEAADRFRAARGLHAAADMLRWLEESGLNAEQFEALLTLTVEVRRFKDALAEPQIAPRFEAERGRWDRVRLIEVEGLDAPAAAALLAQAREVGLAAAACAVAEGADLPRFGGALATRFAHRLPEAVREAPPGAILGPFGSGGNLRLVEVLGRAPAALDEETRGALREEIVAAWLAERRAAAQVEWHWT
ncbi:TIGR04500 family putative peptide maturation system protein [Methylobacterium sp. JK268]